MKQQIMDQLTAQKGHVGFYYKNLVTGQQIAYQEEEAFLAASVIKLPIFMYLSLLDAEGKVSMTEKITVKEEDKLPICGALTLFTDEPVCDIRTLCNLMISLSDNTATNLLIRRLGIEAYREGFLRMGLKGTVLERYLFDTQAAEAGAENKIVLREMAMLLEQIYRREFVSPKVSQKIEETLCLQQIQHKIRGILGEEVRAAHKTGEDDGLTNDVGIIFAKQPFILCCAAHDTCVPEFEDFIRHTAAALYKECNQ